MRVSGILEGLGVVRTVDCGEGVIIVAVFSTNSQLSSSIRTFLGENSRFFGENLNASCGQIQKRLWNIWGISKKKDFRGKIETFLGSRRRNSGFDLIFRKFGRRLSRP
jgi:hypothetical protein